MSATIWHGETRQRKFALSVPKASAKVMNEITFCKSGCCEVARVELGLVPYGV